MEVKGDREIWESNNGMSLLLSVLYKMYKLNRMFKVYRIIRMFGTMVHSKHTFINTDLGARLADILYGLNLLWSDS